MISASKLQESAEVRITHSLHTNEEEFVAKRRDTVSQSLQKHGIHSSQDAVPNIALLGSGGGQRAMVGLLGSLVQLDKGGLLDCVLYLSGVSGSTWCMASLYKEPDWSTKLESVKNKIVERLNGPAVSWGDVYKKLKTYYNRKDFFSLTDVWAAMVITTFVKEIDEHTLTDQWERLSKDPLPIYTVIDKQSKQEEKRDTWVEIGPHEAGYSLTGAFVDTSSFSSQFDNGSKKKQQPEMDMLYLQALCGSALAEGSEIRKFLWKQIKDFFKQLTPIIESEMIEEMRKDPKAPSVCKCYKVLMDVVDVNLCVLNHEDPSANVQSISRALHDLGGDQSHRIFLGKNVRHYTDNVCNRLSHLCSPGPSGLWICISILTCMSDWIWGRNYNFLHKMTDEAVPHAFVESETRDYEDAGLLLNSPYFSVLREERHTDLIISLDFSERDHFMTVTETQKLCEELKIPFPEVHITSEDVKKPKDFYVFKGKNAPTVIHIPVFNVANCKGDIEAWRNKYRTFQGPYSAEKITDLMEVAGKNISNNREKLLEEIGVAVGQKKTLLM